MSGPWRAGGVNVYRALSPDDPTDFSGRAIAWAVNDAAAVLIADALNTTGGEMPTGAAAHQPGDHHRYRIECEVCGQRGTIRLSVDPEVAEPDAAVSPVRPEEPPE